MRKARAALLGILLAGCAGTPDDRGSGNTFISVVGTPFLIAFKIPVCVASAAIAAPLAGVSALNPDSGGREFREALGAGVAQNCGPPYVVSP
jgi:hypothetical protein